MPKRGYNSDRAWQTRQAKLQREHEFKLAFLNAMAKDPEFKFYCGVMLGSAAAVIGAMTTGVIPEGEGAGVPTPSLIASPFGWLGGQFAEAAGVPTYTEGTGGDYGAFSFIPGIMSIAGGGFAGFCAAVLLLKAIFGDEDVSGLLEAVNPL